ncbi:hypothetical protein [Arthrobacter sp. TMT4-20]
MAYDPVLLFAVLGMFGTGLLGLILLVVGASWFISNPKQDGESLLHGKRAKMLALCAVSFIFLGIGIIPFTGLFLPLLGY